MLKRVIQFAAVASAGLIIGDHLSAGVLSNRREQTSPACHPAYGYHQTCWRRFPALPPCDTYGTGLSSSMCEDGSCQTVPVEITDPMIMEPQAVPDWQLGGHSGRYSSVQSPVPMNTNSVHNRPDSAAAPLGGPIPQPLTPAPTGGGRYQPGHSLLSPPQPAPLPQSIPSTPRPTPVPPSSDSGVTTPNALPDIPTQQSSGLSIPAQGHAFPTSSRYRFASAGTTQQPVRPTTQTVVAETAGTHSRYPVRPRRPQTQLLAAPLLKQPVNPR